MSNDTTMTPAGATTLYPWGEDANGEPVRCFIGTAGTVIETPTGTIDIEVGGVQSMRDVARAVVINGVELTIEHVDLVMATLAAGRDEVAL